MIRLLEEASKHPYWAICHLFGMIDQHFILRFHQRKVNEYCHASHDIGRVISFLGQNAECEIETIFNEFKKEKRKWTNDPSSQYIPAGRDASVEFQFLLFALVLLNRPDRVLEIGVARGASSRALLTALELTGKGKLVSIDFPFLLPNYKNEIGMLVPAKLRKKWSLHIGPSQLILPKLLKKESTFQLIVHDGAHSYNIQRKDLNCCIKALEPGGDIVCDDLNNDSFLETTKGQFDNILCVKQTNKAEPIGLGWQRRLIIK
jgi:predicted O-methyltransferase YrrM